MSSIEHELKIRLKSSTVKVVSEKKLPPTKFAKKYSNTKIIHCFLKDINFKDNIEVPLMCVPIDHENTRHKVYFCEVAVGKSLFVGKKYATMFQPPDDCDNFIVEIDDIDTQKSLRQSHLDINKPNKYIEEKNKRHGEQPYTSTDEASAFTHSNKTHYPKDMEDRNSLGESSTYVNERSYNSVDKGYSSKDKSNYTNASTTKGRDSPYPRCFSPKISDDLTNTDINLNNLHYIIKDPSKINPLYEVVFDYDKLLDNREKYMCDKCGDGPCVVSCLAERASFCKNCDRDIHNDKFTQRHIRFYYNSKKDCTVAMCSTHFEELLEQYCKKCNSSFCKKCKQDDRCPGSDDEKHDFVDFSNGCDHIKGELDSMKEELENISNTLTENIQTYQSDLNMYNLDVKKAKQTIEMEYQNALTMLNNIVRQKYQVYNALYVEKLVVKEKMKRIVEFIENADTVEVVKEYNVVKSNKELIDVKPVRIKREKIIVKGELKVFCGDEKIKDEIYVDSSYRKNRY